MQRDVLGVDPSSSGALLCDRAERLEESGGRRHFREQRREVASRRHQALTGAVRGGVARADYAARTRERGLVGRELDAGVGAGRLRLTAVAHTDRCRRIAGGLDGGDTERFQQRFERPCDA